MNSSCKDIGCKDKKETEDSKQYEIIESKAKDIQEGQETILHNPKTGDNIIMWISLMVVSMLGITVIVKYTRKNK